MQFLKKGSWTIDLEKIPPYTEWKGDWHYKLDRFTIELILQCEEVDEDGNPLITDVMKTHFKNNIVDRLRNNTLYIKWEPKKGGVGRYYSSESGNLGVHSKRIKETLYKIMNWIDYDMVKGHPTILLNMAKFTNFTGGLPAIQRYIDNFDSISQEMIEYYSIPGEIAVTKGDIKDLHNLTIYGGGPRTWVEQLAAGDEKKGKLPKKCNPVPHPKYKEFYEELQNVINIVYSSNPKLAEIVCKQKEGAPELPLWKKKSTTMSYFCGIIENEILRHAYKYGVKNKLFPPKRIDLCFDGFTAPLPEGDIDIDYHIEKMNEYIFDNTGFNITMKVKPFDKYIPSIVERSLIMDSTPILSEYDKRKLEFEKTHAYVGSFILHKLDDGTIEWVKPNDMRMRQKNNHFNEYSFEKKKQVKVFFFDRWLEDETRRTYSRVGFFPNISLCPPDTYNLFDGFNAEKFKPDEDMSPQQIYDLCLPILRHIDLLTDGYAYFLLSWLAHIVQKPEQKIGVAPIIRDKPSLLVEGGGTGKNMFEEWFGNEILGEQYVCVVQDNDELYSQFNSIFEGKLLIIIEEAEGKSNHQNHDALKAKITARTISINRKGIPQYIVIDYANYLFNTNGINSLPIRAGNRRFGVVDVNPEMRGNIDYFTYLANYLKRPDVKWAFYQYLKSYKTYDSQIEFANAIPITDGYKEMRRLNCSNILKWLAYELTSHNLHNNKPISGLYDDYREWIRKNREGKEESAISLTSFGLTLNAVSIPDVDGKNINIGHKRVLNGKKIFVWDFDSLVDGLKRNYLLDDDFKYDISCAIPLNDNDDDTDVDF